MNIIIVDDHVLYREGLVSLLASHPGYSVIGEAGTVREAIDTTLKLKPDLVLLDISLPDGSGLEALRAINTQQPNIKVVMLTVHETEDLLLSAIRDGALGYLVKSINSAKLIKSLNALERGETALSRTMISSIVGEFQRIGKTNLEDKSSMNLLTGREIEVLELVGNGMLNKEIALHLHISENTVKIHIHNILKKLNLRNRKEAGQFARRNLLRTRPPNEPPLTYL